MVRTGCEDTPCHTPKELWRRLREEPKTDIRIIREELLRELERLGG